MVSKRYLGQKYSFYKVQDRQVLLIFDYLSLWFDLEEKCLRNSKIGFDGVFLSIYLFILKKLELSKLCTKK